ncbi:FAD/NAD(P)-binding protein [Halobacillus massiliensis]|uniref:FAD/NAD(P)-binding protein n=1 Tax=Halobacillus massiliensis TaxID=1926286 RepID=UPI0015C495BD|nr:FAD/NAD(P)-binding protein [Halobacillus massiliensis]
MYQWVIIGGGIQGCTIAAHLLLSGKVNKNDLLIIDPFPEPLEKWKRLTQRVGMDYLRSPSVRHLHPDPYHLKSFAKTSDYAGGFKGYYKRPKLDMFNDHCMEIFEIAGLENCWETAWAESLDKNGNLWSITTSSNRKVVSKQVVLALGVNDQPYYPGWAEPLVKEAPDLISHVFSERGMEAFHGASPAAITGAGTTAVHLALKQAHHSSEPVYLIKRHPFRVKDFDSDPGWLGPKFLNQYERINSYQERRKVITKARNRGSVTQSLYSLLKRREAEGKIEIITDDIMTADVHEGKIKLQLKKQGKFSAGSLLLATGAASCLPGKGLVEEVIRKNQLPCAPCGFPVVSKELEWADGLFVSGALAELEIGPVARNIAGARKAAQRILERLEERLSERKSASYRS